MWQLIGPEGGLHFTASHYKDNDDWTCGLEIHRSTPADYQKCHAPSDTNCWLIGGRCWHDGTSLYARETVWPRVEYFLNQGKHKEIFDMLEREYEKQFEKEEI